MGFLSFLYMQMANGGLNNIKDVNGGLQTLAAASNSFGMNAGAGAVYFGILVGTGTTPVTVTDYSLATRINNGSGAGQLNYLIVSITTPATVGNTQSFTVSRGFTNNSGNSITVNEVGMVSNDSGSAYVLIDRTLMSFSIANGATGIVTYTIQVSV